MLTREQKNQVIAWTSSRERSVFWNHLASAQEKDEAVAWMVSEEEGRIRLAEMMAKAEPAPEREVRQQGRRYRRKRALRRMVRPVEFWFVRTFLGIDDR